MENKNILLLEQEIGTLHRRHLLSESIYSDYYDPGNMEYLAQSDGIIDDDGCITLRFESRGTRYEGRTEIIEQLNAGDPVSVVRDPENKYNTNNFALYASRNRSIGNMPADLCNAIAPLYDVGQLIFDEAHVSFVEPITKRSRYAKQAVLFIELNMHILRDNG